MRKNTLKRNYYNIPKLNAGPGGWHCPCCNPYRTPPVKMKVLARRRVRRQSKQERKWLSDD